MIMFMCELLQKLSLPLRNIYSLLHDIFRNNLLWEGGGWGEKLAADVFIRVYCDVYLPIYSFTESE